MHATTNKGADHPGHPHSLISDFGIRPLGSIITIKLDMNRFSILGILCS